MAAISTNEDERAESARGSDIAAALSAGVTVNGTSGNDIITPAQTVPGQPFPGDDDDTVYGFAGNDTIDGGAGADMLYGGTGDDTYHVDDAGDRVFELQGQAQGNDRIFSSVSYSLAGQFIETLTLTGNADINAFGNSQANILEGNAGNNILHGNGGNDTIHGNAGDDTIDGGAGADMMYGGAGDDTYYIDTYYSENFGDRVFELEGEGNDRIFSAYGYDLAGQFVETLTLTGSSNADAFGNDQANTLVGNSGDNLLDGRGGADVMAGGWGDDTYVVDNAGDVVDETNGRGRDTVRSSATYSLASTAGSVENLTLIGTEAIDGTGNALGNVLIGNAAANTLRGNAGNDTLDGEAGADMMHGGVGDDIYYVDDTGDRVFELQGEGNDRIFSSVSYSLLARFVETLALTGDADIDATGNSLANTLIGNSGANHLNGQAGADVMRGGGGNDTYVIDDAGDVIDETDGAGGDAGGVDRVFTSISLTALAPFVEDVTIYAGENFGPRIEVTGNDLDNRIESYGGWGPVSLYGNGGNDELDGAYGDDQLYGGAGQDVLSGSSGRDQLTGGADADIFSFEASRYLNDSTLGFINTIMDFDRAEGDRLAVLPDSSLDTLVFRGEVGTPGFTLTAGATLGGEDLGPGFTQLWSYRDGSTTYLIGDTNDDRTLDSDDLVVALAGSTAPLVLTEDDFIDGSFGTFG